MNVALLGSGGREHALAWKLCQSPRLGKLHAWPGNPGIAAVSPKVTCRGVNINDGAEVVRLAKEADIKLVIVGPEDPLAKGVADALAKAGIACFGPSQAAAKLEADKAFAKDVMKIANVPTAESRTFIRFNEADRYVKRREAPMVVKAAGLAKGKGVTICRTNAEAAEAVKQMMKLDAFGDAGHTVVVEDLLEGVECSLLALVDGRSIYTLPACQDHKPVGDGNTGPMTGGMGAFCPADTLTDTLRQKIETDVIVPTLDVLARDDVTYRGCLYVGLMLTSDGPRVLEFNVRFGDPETQPLMARWKGDLLEAFYATATGTLADFVDGGGIEFADDAAVCVVVASGGYPGDYTSGREITGVDQADLLEGVQVFHAGTARRSDTLVTDGGRVLGVTATGSNLKQARERAYAACGKIKFVGAHYRSDIGSM